MISPFVTSLAIGVMFAVSSIAVFFSAALFLEWCIRKIHGVKKR